MQPSLPRGRVLEMKEPVIDLSFLAVPDEVLDWRRLLLTAAAVDAGILAVLPADVDAIAGKLNLDTRSIRVLLDALKLWNVVSEDSEIYRLGDQAPADSEGRAFSQHAAFLRRWGNDLPDRLQSSVVQHRQPRSAAELEPWLRALGDRARVDAPDVISRCLQRFPKSRTIVDVAGGHGEYGLEAARRGHAVTLLDLPAVVDIVTGWSSIPQSGIETLAADVFEYEPDRQFDLVLCFGFTHTQPPERVKTLFAKLAKLTAPGGGIAVQTFLRGVGPVAPLFAVQMLTTGGGGDTHRLSDYSTWLTEAGFGQPEVIDLASRSLLLAKRA